VHRRSVVERTPRVFADVRGPHGNPLTNLTIADVINAAHAQHASLLRKADLLATHETGDAGQPARVSTTPRTAHDRGRGSIIIIPSRPRAAR
jgi:hypothetical protein